MCAGCRHTIKNKEFLECPLCKKKFDLICSGITSEQFRDMNASCKLGWKCPECRTKQPKKDNTNTPVHSSRRDRISEDLTIDSEKLETQTQGSCETTLECKTGDISQIVKREVSAAIRSELSTLFKSNFDPIKSQLDDLQESMKFISSQYEDFKDSIHKIADENKALKTECTQLRETVTDLSYRLNTLEQHMRDSNLEIQGVPESRSENVVCIVKQVAQVVSAKLSDEDILNCTRVAAMNKKGQRPRTIVVKLRSVRCRDEVYSAVQKYNKAHPNEKLNSSHLGIAGEKSNVYVCEHLSPANKALHAAARIKSRELGYKYTWVRNGHLYSFVRMKIHVSYT